MRHPELKLELELNREVKRHQRELASAFAEARLQAECRHAAIRRQFPARHRYVFPVTLPDGTVEWMTADQYRRGFVPGHAHLSDPMHAHNGAGD